jgi:hypothetical protein
MNCGGTRRTRSPQAGRVTILAVGLWVLASATWAGCARPPASSESHQAGLLIVFPDGRQQKACVTFAKPELSGEELLNLSGISYSSDPLNPMGVKVCSIEGVGCNFPDQDCFCQCSTPGSCTYWAYFNLQGQRWVYSPLGARAHIVEPGGIDAWVWLKTSSADEQGTALMPVMTLSDFCGTP